MRSTPLAMAILLLAIQPLRAQDPAPLLAKIKAVGKEGKGNPEAAQAWQKLVAMDKVPFIPTLAAFEGANPAALNMLRLAVDAMAERTRSKRISLPREELEKFVLDTKGHPRARRTAFEWLAREDMTAKNRLLPRFLDDPGQELRREAVDVLLVQPADKLLAAQQDAEAKAAYQKVLEKARDRDQLLAAAKNLEKLGDKVNLTEHFGFITNWMLAAPFENRKGVGYAASYPPDKGVDLKAAYKGQDDKEVRWEAVVANQPMGLLDIAKIKGNLKGAVAYAFTVVDSPKERPIEIRAGSNNAVRIYLNGKEIFGREEYHHGMQIDQHIGKGTLKAGRNEILVKVCQNEQTESWAQQWSIQLRVTDDLGARVPLTVAANRP
jgi:hypothetical protein